MVERSLHFLAVFMFLTVQFSSLTRITGRCQAFAFRHRTAPFNRAQSTLRHLRVQRLVSCKSAPALIKAQWFADTRLPIHRFSTFLHHSVDPTIHDTDRRLLDGLNAAQIEAVTQPLSSITRVVAGPGAGKTRVLTSRIAYLLHSDPDRRILAVTFTKKAAGEMQERLERLLEAPEHSPSSSGSENDVAQEEVAADAASSSRQSTGLDRVTLGTFHSVCAKILRWNGRHLATLPSVVQEMTGVSNVTNLDGSFAIVDQGEQIRLVKECATDLGIDLKSQDIKPQPLLNALAKVKSSLAMGQDPLKSGRKVPSKTLQVGVKLYPLYRRKLLTRNALDFDDLILMTRELLTVHEEIRDNLRRRWPHVLVDEFQDTSQSQLDLVKLLSSDSLLVVGDADQSIYSWRGAHAESMSDFVHQFDDRLSGVDTVHLMENYRSTTNIVNAAQKIISSDLSSSKQADLRQDMKPMRGSGPTPRVLACADAKAEASFVVKTIEEAIASGDYNSESSVAIIYRTNAQSRALEEACVQANLPYVVRGSSGAFYKRAEIQDCLCFLRLLRSGRDEAAMRRAIKTPSRGIGDVAYQEFCHFCTKVEGFYESNYPGRLKPTPFDVLLSLANDLPSNRPDGIEKDVPSAADFMSKRALNRFIPFSKQMCAIYNKAQTLTVSDLLSWIIVHLELRSHIDSISKSSSEFSDRWSNVIELRRAAQRYGDEGASTRPLATNDSGEPNESPLTNFLDDVALVTDMADEDSAPVGSDKRIVVNLMTIHASKGMEFDGVFLVGVEDGTLPSKLSIIEGEGSVALDEEKRLCYVAMTRAKTHLVMTWRREVSSFNGNTFTSVKAERSRFLDILVGSKSKKSSKNGKGSSSKLLSSSGNSQTPLGRSGRADSKLVRSLPRAGKPSATRHPARANGSRRAFGRAASADRVNGHRGEQKQRSTQRSKQVSATQPVEIQRRATLGKREVSAAKNGVNPRKVSRKQETSSGPTSSDSMDSTWFYPVGSSVVHTRLGNGVVLPPPASTNGEMLVRVLFENGAKHNLPADGKDLHLKFT